MSILFIGTSFAQECREQLFHITAYYSPILGQSIYLRPDYDAEIKLNGRGVRWASWKSVFNGMIAAPRTYSFGTRIILPGFGTWEVSDRGGAIIAWSTSDRIDIRVWQWDEWLQRAKSLGRVMMTGFVCSWASFDTSFDHSVIPNYVNFSDVAVWSIDQDIGRSWLIVSTAQRYLQNLWYAEWITQWVFDDMMKQNICRYQRDRLWFTWNEETCWFFGPQTRAQLFAESIKKWFIDKKSLYQTSNFDTIHPIFLNKNHRPSTVQVVEQKVVFEPLDIAPAQKNKVLNTMQKQWLNTASWKILPWNVVSWNVISWKVWSWNRTVLISKLKSQTIIFDRPRSIWQRRDSVKDLQKILQNDWLYQWKIDWMYDNSTRRALIAFQRKYTIITPKSDPRVIGVAGPATRALLEQKYKKL